MAGFQRAFPFNPNGMDWEAWNGNLIMFYAEEPIPFHDEDNWRQTASSVAQLAVFNNYPVPQPDAYADWQDWANEFTLIINGQGH